MRDRLQTCLIVPCTTRWNYYFNAIDAVRQVIDRHSGDKRADVFQTLDVSIFQPYEPVFMKEYCCAMHTLAFALDVGLPQAE